MTTITFVHVVLSLVGLGSGAVVTAGLFKARRLEGWTALFLATTVATSATGFAFPFIQFLPSHGVGILSLLVLAVAMYARYSRRLEGAWRAAYVVGAVLAFYLNSFVLVVQLFLKVPALRALAPTQTEPPFLATQLVVLVLFVLIGIAAVRRFRVGAAGTGDMPLVRSTTMR